MDMKKIIAWLCVLLALTAALSAAAESTELYYGENEWNFVDGSMDVSSGIPENASGVLDRIRRTGVLRVATEPYFAPQEFIDPALEGQNQYAGADMELARLIAERMGVRLEIVPFEDFTQVLPSLTEDQCDLAISGIAFTPVRATSYTLSKGYYYSEADASTGFVIREGDRENITSEEDLRERILAAQSGSLQEALAADHVRSYLEFRRFSSVQQVYDAVQSGKADAGVVDVESAEDYMRNNPGCGLVFADNLYYRLEEYQRGDRIAAKKGEQQLLFFVNGVISEILENGQYVKWIESAQARASELGL